MHLQQRDEVLINLARALVTVALLSSACATGKSPQPGGPQTFGNDTPGPTAAPNERNSSAPDPTVTDGDKYHVVLQNEHVRVLRYQDKPGDKTRPHRHSKFVLYALSPFRRRLTFPDGTVKERDFNAGDVIWMPAQVHTGENVGTTDTDVVIVELLR